MAAGDARDATRRARLSSALRDNLRKRRAQEQARAAAAEGEAQGQAPAGNPDPAMNRGDAAAPKE
jgi:hypothetical protein